KHKKQKKHKRSITVSLRSQYRCRFPRHDLLLKPICRIIKNKGNTFSLFLSSVPTFTVHPGVARPPSPLMIIDNDDSDDDEDDEDEEPSVPLEQYRAWLDEDSNMASSPMPRWLDALEKGELDDNGDLKKEVDESLLTARQKALLHKQQIQPLLELPMGYKEKEMTAEMMLKREERAKKRRLQRLTKTSKAKIKSMRDRKSKQNQCPMVRYRDTAQGVAISFPTGVVAPCPVPPRAPLPGPVHCGVSGCNNVKKYACSKTGVPLCSLECYKRNLLLVQSAA
uniref:INO80 complex subunit B-like conserved region domain-containing protein n=1 Tax=Neogobius melanostomus TaxID=47308 RepID=A0A8C6WWR8_9GOBI